MMEFRCRPAYFALHEVLVPCDSDFFQNHGSTIFFAKVKGRNSRTTLAARHDQLMTVTAIHATADIVAGIRGAGVGSPTIASV